LLCVLGAVAAVLLVVARFAPRSQAGALLHTFVTPYVAVVCVYELACAIIERHGPTRWDSTLSAFDLRWFDGLGEHWRGAFGRPAWLTDLAYVAYVAFYALPLVVGVALYRGRRPADFVKFVLGTETSFFLSYLGYMAFPAQGPLVPVSDEARVLGGGAFSAGVRAFIRAVDRSNVDAFPSGHTLVSLVVLAFAWHVLPRWRAPLVAAVAAIIFSTVYLSFHYVADVAAGVFVAVAIVLGAL
jgi:membrane-associated phospholipid phosphatase